MAGLIIRLILLAAVLLGGGTTFAWVLAHLFQTLETVLLPFVLIAAAILLGAVGYLISCLLRCRNGSASNR